MRVARNPAQHSRLLAEAAEDAEWGDDVSVLTKTEATERVRVSSMLSASFTPHCARIQPAALVRGLADAVERLGVTIYEQTPVTAIRTGCAVTSSGRVDAPVVVRATEGFTATLPGLRRRWLPMNSSMIVTSPLTSDMWEAIGWQGVETLGDTAHGFFYAQRTADDRIAIGGRAVPYRYASRIDRDGEVDARTVKRLAGVLYSVFPQTRDVADHARLVWRARRAARLERLRRLRSRHRPGLGGRLRRAWGDRDESGRADPGGSSAAT